jgi:predicted O-linked N-acetylglucosamine transferase (SPINDLY family)
LALARSYQESGEREKALETFETGARLQPENVELRWGHVFTQLALIHDSQQSVQECRATFSDELDKLDRWFDSSRTPSGFTAVGTQQPFYLAYAEESNRKLLTRYGALCNRLAANWQREQGLQPRTKRRRGPIRLGIVSAHIFDHSVWNALVKGWCDNLDPKRVELHLFSLGSRRDAKTAAARKRALQFDEGARKPDGWARTILERDLDALLYPEIGMDPMAAKLATLSLAPVQMTTWGQPDTSGLPTIDYYLSAEDFEPSGAEDHYTERLQLLPHLSCCYEALEVPLEDVDLGKLGIDPENPIFICPGTPFKYAPKHDRVLVEIAARMRACHFVLFKYPLEGLFRQFRSRLAKAFAEADLRYEDFFVEIPWLSKPSFNSLMRKGTVFLDTIGFSGFNTAMQAIECGLPIVTKDGSFMRGRLASGVLKRLGMLETIAPSEEQYVELAVKIAQNPELRERLGNQVRESRHVLFDDVEPVRALEDFLMTVRA